MQLDSLIPIFRNSPMFVQFFHSPTQARRWAEELRTTLAEANLSDIFAVDFLLERGGASVTITNLQLQQERTANDN